MRRTSPSDVLRRLRALEDREQAKFDLRFFRTGPGDYGEGDLFLGIRVPQVRKLAREFSSLSLKGIEQLLASKWHEARLLALVIMVSQYKRADERVREAIFRAYLRNTHRINSWDLVDVSARDIVGEHLATSNRSLLTRLARSKSLWERRIAMVATHQFIRHGDLTETFRIAKILLRDEHDLIHKAAGWMLREAGKIDRAAEEAFLEKHGKQMPRTMLRYAIELFPEKLRRRFLART
jgi:3-methyladenine DNA glycosylase AlkD